MKNKIFSLFILIFADVLTGVAQSQADSALLLDKTLWHTVATLPDGAHVTGVWEFDSKIICK